MHIPQAGKKPTRKAPLRGNKFKQSQHDINTQDHEPQVVDKRQVCVDVLLEGYVHAYVDLFYLTHRNDPQSNTPIQISESEMNKLRENLTQAEQARRSGDTQAVFKSYTRLAAYYNDIQDVKTAIFFYEKCLEIARLTMDPQAELTALHNIGTAHFNCGAYEQASEYHEEQLQKAKTTLSDEFERKANLQLTQVYKKMAQEQEQIDVAVEFYRKSLEVCLIQFLFFGDIDSHSRWQMPQMNPRSLAWHNTNWEKLLLFKTSRMKQFRIWKIM